MWKRPWRMGGVSGLSILALSLGASGDVCSEVKPGLRAAESVTFFAGDEEAASVLDRAIDEWGAGCAAEASAALPRLERRESAELATYRVQLRRSNPSGPQCGWFRGRDIVVYRFATGERGRALHCGDPALVLAHEIGHALGLGDVDAIVCPHSIMATIHSGNRHARRVGPQDCSAVAVAWTRPTEESRPAETAPTRLAASGSQPQPAAPPAVSADERAVAAPRN